MSTIKRVGQIKTTTIEIESISTVEGDSILSITINDDCILNTEQVREVSLSAGLGGEGLVMTWKTLNDA